jgi:hypothetical protein
MLFLAKSVIEILQYLLYCMNVICRYNLIQLNVLALCRGIQPDGKHFKNMFLGGLHVANNCILKFVQIKNPSSYRVLAQPRLWRGIQTLVWNTIEHYLKIISLRIGNI